MIADILLILPTLLLTTSSTDYCLKEKVYDVDLRRSFYSKQDLKDLLRSMPLGNSMDMGKGYDDMIGCATCSLSQCLMQ